MAERRLAIAIKGGVSLGAYEAGVIAETLYLLDYNNRRNGVKWYVDALAGASAGGMTAAMVAAVLLDATLAGAAPDNNLLKKVWVDTISLDLLDPADGSGLSPNFLFAPGVIDKMAADFIKFPNTLSLHSVLRPPSAARAAHVALALTLSRLGQGQHSVPTFTGKEFVFNEHAALSRFDIKVRANATGAPGVTFSGGGASSVSHPTDGADLDSAAAFAGMLSCAIACGAFPFAFAPRGIALQDDSKNWHEDYFTDGGLYDNDPVGQVINLAHEIDWSADAADFDDTDRRYLMIEPEPPESPDHWPNAPQFAPGTNMLEVNPLEMVGRILSGALQQLQQSGVRGIPEVNRRLKMRQNLVAQIEYFIHTSSGDFAAPSWLAEMVNKLGAARGLSPEQMNYFRTNYISDLQIEAPIAYGGARSLPADRKQPFIEFGLLIDLAMDVADKVAFEPILVCPAVSLAGDPLYGFKGFFDVRIRQHDFAQGVLDAYEIWKGVQKRETSLVLVLPETSPPPPPAAPDILDTDNAQLNKVQQRLDVLLDSAVNSLPDAEKLWAKAMLEWQIKLFIGLFLRSVG